MAVCFGIQVILPVNKCRQNPFPFIVQGVSPLYLVEAGLLENPSGEEEDYFLVDEASMPFYHIVYEGDLVVVVCVEDPDVGVYTR